MGLFKRKKKKVEKVSPDVAYQQWLRNKIYGDKPRPLSDFEYEITEEKKEVKK